MAKEWILNQANMRWGLTRKKKVGAVHEKFTNKYGGKVFYIISIAEKKRKVIHNIEVVEEIRREIERLRK